IVEGGVGEHHAEAKRVVGAVALVDRNLGLRPLLFEQDRGVETGRAATDDRDLHEGLRKSSCLPDPIPFSRIYFKIKTIRLASPPCLVSPPFSSLGTPA